MEIVLVVLNNSIIKTIRSPSLSVVRNGDGLTETVQLETGAADGIHDGSVVDDLNGNLALLGTNDKISMSCSSRNSKKARKHAEYPNGSPTTKKAVFCFSAESRIISALDSTRSRSAMMTSFSKNFS